MSHLPNKTLPSIKQASKITLRNFHGSVISNYSGKLSSEIVIRTWNYLVIKRLVFYSQTTSYAGMTCPTNQPAGGVEMMLRLLTEGGNNQPCHSWGPKG